MAELWTSPASKGFRLWSWVGARLGRSGRVPDPVTDTTLRRKVKAWGRFPMLRRVRREAIRRGSCGILVMLTVHFEGELYDAQTAKNARQRVRALVGHWPAWWTLEEGQSGGLHLHILTVIDAVPGLPDGVHGMPVYDLFSVLCYLSKPHDANAARSNHARVISLDALHAAAERYLDARAARHAEGFKRLPVLSGCVNMPRRKKARPLPLLVLWCAIASLGLEASRLERWQAVIALRRARRPLLPKEPPRPVKGRFRAVAGLPAPPPYPPDRIGTRRVLKAFQESRR